MTPDHYQRLGELTAAAASVEHYFQLVLADFVSHNEAIANAVLSPLAFDGMVRLGERLVKQRADLSDRRQARSVEDFRGIAGRARELMKQRNAFIHGLWIVMDNGGDGTPATVTRSRTGEMSFEYHPDARVLASVALKLRMVGSEIIHWHPETLSWNGAYDWHPEERRWVRRL